MTQSSKAVPYRGLEMAMSPAEARARLTELQAFVQSAMVDGVDYGVVPGTGKSGPLKPNDPKPKASLFQPGAQKLCELYGFAWQFEDLESVQDWDKPFFFYRRRCVITLRRDSAQYVGDGRGSCNSREDRYAWRWMFQNQLPKGTDITLLKSKSVGGKGGGPSYAQFRMPNEDIFSLVNTIEKMACKRALVHAVIGATRSAAIFTQDKEDLPADAFGQEDQHSTWERPEAPSGPVPPPTPANANQTGPQGPQTAKAAPPNAPPAQPPQGGVQAALYAEIEHATSVKMFEVAQKNIVIAHKTGQISPAEYTAIVARWNVRRAKLANEGAAPNAAPSGVRSAS